MSGIKKWLSRDTSQDVCPWNVRFAQELKEPAFAPREVLAGRDARTLARELLAMSQEEFSAAFKGSPMKRAKLRGLKRNAAVVLGSVGTADDVPVLQQALEDPEPRVREHAAWALARLRDRALDEERPAHTARPRQLIGAPHDAGERPRAPVPERSTSG